MLREFVACVGCLGKLQLAPRLASSLSLKSNDTGLEVTEFTRFLLRRLVRGLSSSVSISLPFLFLVRNLAVFDNFCRNEPWY